MNPDDGTDTGPGWVSDTPVTIDLTPPDHLDGCTDADRLDGCEHLQRG